MITQSDIAKLEKTFATKKDLEKFAKKQDLEKFATKDEVITKLDAILGEIQAMREEMTVFAYRQSNHSDRIESLELHTFGKSFA